MIDCIILNNGKAITNMSFLDRDGINKIVINYGYNKSDNYLNESLDFSPNYSSLNSCLFESSVILTVWEHAEELFTNDYIAFMHTDVSNTEYFDEAVDRINNGEYHNQAIGMVVPPNTPYDKLDITDCGLFSNHNDPWAYMNFSAGINIWKLVRQFDSDAFDWHYDNQIQMIYCHQFLCNRTIFDSLGHAIARVVRNMKLQDVGLWTPHVIERIVAIRLAMSAECRLLAMLEHHMSSGSDNNNLYGVRPYKFLRVNSKYHEINDLGVL